MSVRVMQPGDVDRVVDVHVRSFPGFFLTFLGPKFLKLLYRSILEDESGIALVAGAEGQTAGFVAGTTQPAGFYKRLLKKQLVGFALASVGGLVRQPGILPRLMRAFSMPGQALPEEKCATLMSIAVDPACQGQSYGKALVRTFLDEARKRGAEFVNLTTDRVDNEATNHFYQSLGFQLFRSYVTPEGRAMNEYLICCG